MGSIVAMRKNQLIRLSPGVETPG